LGRELVSFYRLSIQTTLVSGNVWPQFEMQILTIGVANPQFGGKGGRMRSEMGPTSRPGMTSYRLPIVTISLSLTVFAVLRMFQGRTDGQTDRRTDGIIHTEAILE